MSAQLHVGGQHWTLPDDFDLDGLKAMIYNAIHRAGTAMGDWVEVEVLDGGLRTPLHLHLSPGVPVAITTAPDYNPIDGIG